MRKSINEPHTTKNYRLLLRNRELLGPAFVNIISFTHCLEHVIIDQDKFKLGLENRFSLILRRKYFNNSQIFKFSGIVGYKVLT